MTFGYGVEPQKRYGRLLGGFGRGSERMERTGGREGRRHLLPVRWVSISCLLDVQEIDRIYQNVHLGLC